MDSVFGALVARMDHLGVTTIPGPQRSPVAELCRSGSHLTVQWKSGGRRDTVALGGRADVVSAVLESSQHWARCLDYVESATTSAQELRERMRAYRVTSLPGRPGSSIASLRDTGNAYGLSFEWVSNHATCVVRGNAYAAPDFLADLPHYSAQLTRIEGADKEAQRLLVRMRKMGIREISGRRNSPIAAIRDTGSAYGLCFEWKSNGVTTPVRGNAAVATAFLTDVGHYTRELQRSERRIERAASTLGIRDGAGKGRSGQGQRGL